jgi:hypothetical protein
MTLRFEVGDRVVVATPSGWGPAGSAGDAPRPRHGVVRSVASPETVPYPYDVELVDGTGLCFADAELLPGGEDLGEEHDESPALPLADHFTTGPGQPDAVSHPDHYNWLPEIEVIDITRHFSFVRGNAIKYLLRADLKGSTLEDLKKACWYVEYEIRQLEREEQTG